MNNLFLSIVILLSLALQEPDRRTLKKASKIIAKELKAEIKLEQLDIDFEEDDCLYSVFSKEGSEGLLVFSSAKGRFEYFDFLLFYDNQFNLQLIKVTNYKSQYGTAIMSKRWLNQFSKINLEEEIKYGKNISAVSGATFSANGLSEAVSRINGYIAENRKSLSKLLAR